MIEASCPVDEDLLPLITGDTIDHSLAAHLDSCSVCRLRLDSFRSDLAAMRSVMPGVNALPRETLKRLATIGKYLVVGRLDGGGQADVFRAVHPTLDTEVAIKLSHKALGRASDHRLLLVAEGKLLAKLDHPNLARIFDLDFHEDRPFLAMEYIRGSTLRAYAEGTAKNPRAAARIIAEVARALAVVHRHGIVHMDIKPQNILMDERERPRLIDFGLARLRHAWDDGDQPFGGTPAYMAPEQARGEAAAVGPAADTFALGGVLYFLLTGKVPYDAPDVERTLIKARAGDYDKTALDASGIPKSLRAITLKAMALKPADRYRRVDDFADALDYFLAGPQRLTRRAMIAGSIIGVGALAAGFWLIPHSPPPPSLPIADPTALEVQILRNGESKELLAALPLNPQTDRVQIVARVPDGQAAVLLFANAKGQIKRLPTQDSPASGYTRRVFPGDGQVVEFDAAGPGTEFVLLLGAETAEPLNGVEAELERTLAVLPPLPPATLVTLDKNEAQRSLKGGGRIPNDSMIDVNGSSFGKREADPAAQVELKLDALRRRLLAAKVTTLRGVAYPR